MWLEGELMGLSVDDDQMRLSRTKNGITKNRPLSSDWDSKKICVFSGLSKDAQRDIGLFTKVVGMYRRKRFWAHCHLWCTYTSAEKAYGKDIIVVLPQSK